MGKAGRDWQGEVRAEPEGTEETLGQDLSLLTFQRPQNDLDLWGLSWSELGQACPVGIMDSGSAKAFGCECQRHGLD